MYDIAIIADLVKKNFFGLHYSKQLEILNMYKEIIDGNVSERLSFENTFENYMYDISVILSFKDEYSKLNNLGKEYLRTLLTEIFKSSEYINKTKIEKYGCNKDTMLNSGMIHLQGNHSVDFIISCLSPSEIAGEHMKYYLSDFPKQNINNQVEIITSFIEYNKNITNENLPRYLYPSVMKCEYDEQMKELLLEYYTEYSKMHPAKRMEFIRYITLELIPKVLSYMEDERLIAEGISTKHKQNIYSKYL